MSNQLKRQVGRKIIGLLITSAMLITLGVGAAAAMEAGEKHGGGIKTTGQHEDEMTDK